jgi:hypothetical protein
MTNKKRKILKNRLETAKKQRTYNGVLAIIAILILVFVPLVQFQNFVFKISIETILAFFVLIVCTIRAFSLGSKIQEMESELSVYSRKTVKKERKEKINKKPDAEEKKNRLITIVIILIMVVGLSLFVWWLYYSSDKPQVSESEISNISTTTITTTTTTIETSKKWHILKTLSGTSDKTTDSFKINSKKWRYTFTCLSSNEEYYSGYNLGLNKLVNEEPITIEFRMMQECTGTETPSYVYDGQGEYFFEISTAGVNQWIIQIEVLK